MLVLMLWIGACSPNPPITTQELNTTEATMQLSQLETTTDAFIPPIDTAIPQIIETATFGLG